MPQPSVTPVGDAGVRRLSLLLNKFLKVYVCIHYTSTIICITRFTGAMCTTGPTAALRCTGPFLHSAHPLLHSAERSPLLHCAVRSPLLHCAAWDPLLHCGVLESTIYSFVYGRFPPNFTFRPYVKTLARGDIEVFNIFKGNCFLKFSVIVKARKMFPNLFIFNFLAQS